MRLALGVEAAVGLVLAAAFVVGYARVPGWWRTQAGRHVMTLTALLGLLLGLLLLGRIVGGLPPVVWVLGVGGLDVLLAGRLWLLIRVQRSRRSGLRR